MFINNSDDPYRERDEQIKNDLRESDKPFLRAMLLHPNVKEAIKIIDDHAGQSHDQAYAPEQERLRRECELGDEQAKPIQEELRALQQQRRATKTHQTVAAYRGTDDKHRRSFAQWNLKDRLTICSVLFFMVLVLCAGAGNVYGALQAEAIPVFLEQWYLAVLLSCLLPAGSVALHCFAELLESDRSRERYTKFISALTFACLIIWVVTFGLNFQIADDALALETFSAPAAHTSVAFTIVQLLSEMLSGTALGLIAAHLHGRYSTDRTVLNPEAESLDQCIERTFARLQALEALHKAGGRLLQLKAMRVLYVTEQVAQFVAVRKRLDETNPAAI